MRDISLHLMDIIQNSITASATKITVSVYLDDCSNELNIEIIDNGKGMDEELLKRVTDPFVTTRDTRKIGLGIPLLKASAQRAGGNLMISSEKGKGTIVRAKFEINNIDRPPLGDLAETMVSVVAANPEIEFELKLKSRVHCFSFNSYEVKERLGEVPITHYEVLEWMREFINEGVLKTFGGVLNEVIG